jgi:hypothetical protein
MRKYEYDDYYEEDTRNKKNKREERRLQRALRTKNIKELVEEDAYLQIQKQ